MCGRVGRGRGRGGDPEKGGRIRKRSGVSAVIGGRMGAGGGSGKGRGMVGGCWGEVF